MGVVMGVAMGANLMEAHAILVRTLVVRMVKLATVDTTLTTLRTRTQL